MLKRQRKIVSVAVALSLAVAMGVGLAGKPVGAANGYGISNPVTDSNGITTWDKVEFGSYYQTAEFEPEPIKWRVLSVDGDDAFLLADENLDCKPYNTEDKAVTWQTCSLRKWLNEDFYNEAFSSSEQEAIKETAVVNDTTDHIYLLSAGEAGSVDYGFVSDSVRESNNTDYAKCNYASSCEKGTGYWWLRTYDRDRENASCVNYIGTVNLFGTNVTHNYAGVRPALHLNLSSYVYADAGEVDSNGNMTNKDDGISAPKTDSEGITTWDCVYLGNYKQKAVWKKEPIEWRVLSVHGDDAFLLADESLDCKPYNIKNEAVTWETCSLRKWLNEDFYNGAFTSSEQAAVRETAVVNEDNSEYGIPGGNDTMDRIYLLSLDEAGNVDYGFVPDFEKCSESRKSYNTDYAKCNHAYSEEGKGEWWLRSPGGFSDIASRVSFDGDVWQIGYDVSDTEIAVRPALHLDLSSSSWSKSGQVSSGEIEVPIPGESSSATENPKPSSASDQTATTLSPVVNPPQATNAPVVTASPIPTDSFADTGKLGKVSIKTAKNSKKSAAVLTWKKVNGASGYQIQYALDQKFIKGRKAKTTAGTSYTLKKLNKKKTYYVRVRAFQKTGSKNVYGAWSKVKKVKIKK